MITRKQLIKKYIDFFKKKNHKEIPNVSLIPENDPTVLFTTAGMHPLVPFLLGQPHPQGKRLVNNQRCIRTQDIDEVGDAFHLTFFEMLGNWSLGDYFKKEAIEMSLEFLTKHLKIPKQKLTITCFKGDRDASKDNEAADAWQSLGIKKEKIKFLGKEDNWWGPAGKTGPCGPCTEMFVNSFEIWNDVFMQYNKNEKGKYKPLKQKNVDTGMGVERTLAILNNKPSVYEIETFQPIIKQIEKLSKKKYGKDAGETRAMRIIADHIKASVFILADKITPSNTEQGYVLRRLIRRAVRYGRFLEIEKFTKQIALPIFKIYDDYKHLQKNKQHILTELEKEEERFLATLEKGLRQAERIFKTKTPISKQKFSKLMEDPNKADLIGRIFDKKRKNRPYALKNPKLSEKEIDQAEITGKESFLLYQSYGFPLEMIDELAMAKGLLVPHQDFRTEVKKHQALSRTATEGRFKSGLADKGEQTTKLHTATHLLAEALRRILKKPDLHQRGSNITPERTRFDFNFDRKLTAEELKKIEDLVNKKIKQKLPVKREELTVEQAKKSGAQGIFDAKYGNKVFVYSIGNFSKEICAGPHVQNTSELGHFKIKKEESSSAGVRRIKAILE
jgi:alanyl-tRNA synthetase